MHLVAAGKAFELEPTRGGVADRREAAGAITAARHRPVQYST